MNRLSHILALMLLTLSSLWSQKENNMWMLGKNIGLDFNAKPITGPGAIEEVHTFNAANINHAFSRKSSICDDNGNLLFYVDGKKIWNKNGEVMEGGDELLTRQGSQVVFMTYITKGECNQYFMFFGSNLAAGQSFLFYHVIDMDANDGIGRVDPLRRSIPLYSGNVRAFSTVSGYGNIWIAILDYDQISNGKLQLFSLKRNELRFVKTVPLNFDRLYSSTCEIKFSPDGSRFFIAESLFLTHDIPLKYYSFNKQTGDVKLIQSISSSKRFLPEYNTNIIAAEFSPSMKFFYTIERYGFCDQLICYAHYKLFQYRLDQNKKVISQSKYQLHYIHEDTPSGMSDLLLGPNKIIYVNRFENNQLDAIKSPDLQESRARFVEGAVSWDDGRTSFKFPNLVLTEPQIIRIAGPIDSLRLCANSQIDLSVDSTYDEIMWWDGDTNPTKSISSAGKYSVTITDKSCEYKEEFQVLEHFDDNSMLPEDTTLCESNQIIVTDLSDKYDRAIWSDGIQALERTYDQPGFYKVEAFKDECRYLDSFNLRQVRIPQELLARDTTMCEGQYVLLDIPYFPARYEWSTGDITKAIRVNETGQYNVKIQDGTCEGVAVSSVREMNKGNLIDIREVESCKGQPIAIDIRYDNEVSYEGEFIDDFSEFNLEGEGEHVFEYYVGNCVFQDTVEIYHMLCIETEIFMPNIFSPNNDGHNDELLFQVHPGVVVHSGNVRVFDRFGNEVWSAPDYQVPWNGRGYNQRRLEAGVYTVFVELNVTDTHGKNIFRKAYDVTLVR